MATIKVTEEQGQRAIRIIMECTEDHCHELRVGGRVLSEMQELAKEIRYVNHRLAGGDKQ